MFRDARLQVDGPNRHGLFEARLEFSSPFALGSGIFGLGSTEPGALEALMQNLKALVEIVHSTGNPIVISREQMAGLQNELHGHKDAGGFHTGEKESPGE